MGISLSLRAAVHRSRRLPEAEPAPVTPDEPTAPPTPTTRVAQIASLLEELDVWPAADEIDPRHLPGFLAPSAHDDAEERIDTLEPIEPLDATALFTPDDDFDSAWERFIAVDLPADDGAASVLG